jgi:hypothetical protein
VSFRTPSVFLSVLACVRACMRACVRERLSSIGVRRVNIVVRRSLFRTPSHPPSIGAVLLSSPLAIGDHNNIFSYVTACRPPYTFVGGKNTYTHASSSRAWNGNDFMLAEVGTQQLEYRYLARATGKRDYAEKAMRAFDVLRELQPSDGLLFEHIKDGGGAGSGGGGWLSWLFKRGGNDKPAFAKGKVSFGACGDSAYEYMLKTWIQGGRKEDVYRRMWDRAMDGMHEQLLRKSSPNGLTYIANRIDGKLEHKMDHLVCFLGGSLALSAYTDPLGLDSPRARRDLRTARALTYTCYQMYARTRTGMAPEYVRFEGEEDMVVPKDSPYSILRPEAVEAFYYLSALTGDPIYRVSFRT